MAEIQMPEKQKSLEENFPIQKPTTTASSTDIFTTKKRKTKTENKLADVLPFISPDADRALDIAWEEVIKPKCQDILLDTLHSIVDTIFDGRGRGRTNYRGGYKESRSYDRASYRDRGRDRDYSRRSTRRRRRDDPVYDEEYSELKFTKSKAHADYVLDHMAEAIDRRGYYTINDMFNSYEDVTDTDVTNGVRNREDDEWGWYSTRGSRIRTVRDGWILELPKPEPID